MIVKLLTEHHLEILSLKEGCRVSSESTLSKITRRLRAKFWPDCAIPDTSMKFGTVVDHE